MSLTKILKEDLGFELQQLITDLENSKGTKANLPERLNSIDQSIQDISQQLEELIGRVDGNNGIIDSHTEEIQSIKQLLVGLTEQGNFNETYQYDTNGNVIKQIVTGDVEYTVDYVYTDPENGILSYSEKKFVQDGKNVTIRKDYSYDLETGNITGVATITTID
jgi:YD repeat-containing protein